MCPAVMNLKHFNHVIPAPKTLLHHARQTGIDC
jgi:hypothetical protein